MQNSSERLQESRETIAYQELPLSSESSLQTSTNKSSNTDSDERDESFSEFKMNDSKYSKVIFSEISESYPTDADIECRFYIGDAVVPTDFDKIGLFRVGWVNANESIIIRSVAECETDNEFGEKKLKFNASELPKHGDEFYQFCYLASNDDICGASTPFRFLRPHEEDLIQLDNRNSDEDDFVVVRSQQALLQERLEHLVNANGVLEYSKRSLEQQIASMEKEMNELRKSKVENEDRIKISQMELSRVMDKLKITEEKNASQSERIEKLEIELAEMKKSKSDCDNQIEASQLELIKVLDMLKSFEAKDSNIEQQLKCRDQEVLQLTKKTADQQVLIDNLASNMAFVEAELELSRTSIAKVMSERRDLDVENKMLRNELEDIKAKCDTLEGNKEIMMSEILDLEKIKLRSKVELKTMKEDMEEMRKKFDETETTQKSMSDEWKVKEEEMQKQLEEMKSRLIHAAEEYQKVYKQNVKLGNRFDRIKTKIKPKSASVSPTREQQELIAAAETEVKTVIESELMAESSDNKNATNSISDKLESITLITLPCSLCREEVTCTARDLKPMTLHLEEKHSQRLCPICSMLFDATLPGHNNYFQMHVENHFDVPNYPSPTAPTAMYP